MDDAKLANGPVKVRCAKCKEIFVVQPDENAGQVTPQHLPEPPSAAQESSSPVEFSFDTPQSSEEPFSQGGDFTFDMETPTAFREGTDSHSGASDEFDWQDGATPSFDSQQSSPEFDLPSVGTSLTPPASQTLTDDNEFDFSETDLNAGSSADDRTAAVEDDSNGFSMDFGEISFSDATPESSVNQLQAFAIEDDETFTQSSESGEEAEEDAGFVPAFQLETPSRDSADLPADERSVNFGDFSFGDAGEDDSADSFVPAGSTAVKDDGAVFASAPVFSEEDQEELPPSSLTTRKKSGSFLPMFVISGAIILIVALVGSGVYFFGGPKAFSDVGLGFLVEWSGAKGGDDGSIVLKGVTASYVMNSTVGEIFVVKGEAVNNFQKPRASIQIKATLLGTGGSVLISKSAFCGNSLSAEQLATLPMAKIEEIMGNQFGDSLANMGLKPGAAIPFTVVVSPLPKEATDYSVTVGGSTVAAQ